MMCFCVIFNTAPLYIVALSYLCSTSLLVNKLKSVVASSPTVCLSLSAILAYFHLLIRVENHSISSHLFLFSCCFTMATVLSSSPLSLCVAPPRPRVGVQ